MKLNITLDEALKKATPGLRAKMEESVALIKKAEKLSLMYDAEDGFWLAFSAGKDSQALYHITELAGVKFKGHFSPTTVDPPQVIRFCRTQYPEVEIGKVKKNIYDMAVEKQILPTMRVRWCCAEYKEMAGAGKVTLIGIRHAESARRAKRNPVEISNRKFSGDFEQFTEWQEAKIRKKYKNLNQDQFSYDKQQEVRCISGKDSILVSPIIEWEEKDVWEFLNNVCEVPHCELYDKGYRRLGCILCPMAQYEQKLREIKDFPYVKAKWIEAIKKIRMGGGITRQTSLQTGGGKFRDNSHWTEGDSIPESRPGTLHKIINNSGGGRLQVQNTETMDARREKFQKSRKAGYADLYGDSTEWTSTREGIIGERERERERERITREVRTFARKQRNLERRWIARQWGLSLMRNLKTRLRRIFSIGGFRQSPIENGTKKNSYNKK